MDEEFNERAVSGRGTYHSYRLVDPASGDVLAEAGHLCALIRTNDDLARYIETYPHALVQEKINDGEWVLWPASGKE